MKLFKLLLLPLFVLMSTNVFSQKIGDGVVLAHFNAEWNKANEVSWLGGVGECNVVKIDIMANPKFQTKHKIVVVPTLILFKDGEEVKR